MFEASFAIYLAKTQLPLGRVCLLAYLNKLVSLLLSDFRQTLPDGGLLKVKLSKMSNFKATLRKVSWRETFFSFN